MSTNNSDIPCESNETSIKDSQQVNNLQENGYTIQKRSYYDSLLNNEMSTLQIADVNSFELKEYITLLNSDNMVSNDILNAETDLPNQQSVMGSLMDFVDSVDGDSRESDNKEHYTSNLITTLLTTEMDSGPLQSGQTMSLISEPAPNALIQTQEPATMVPIEIGSEPVPQASIQNTPEPLTMASTETGPGPTPITSAENTSEPFPVALVVNKTSDPVPVALVENISVKKKKRVRKRKPTEGTCNKVAKKRPFSPQIGPAPSLRTTDERSVVDNMHSYSNSDPENYGLMRKHLLQVTCKTCNREIPGAKKSAFRCRGCKTNFKFNELYKAAEGNSNLLLVSYSSHPDNIDSGPPLLRLLAFWSQWETCHCCLICYKQYKQYETLLCHLRRQHRQEITEENSILSCNKCCIMFHRFSKLEEHLEGESHKKAIGRDFACFKCFKCISLWSGISRHTTFHNKHHLCRFCGMHFVKLHPHLKYACSKVPCPHCFKTFDDVVEHMKDAHPELINCRFCGKTIPRTPFRKKHELKCKKDRYRCSYCNIIVKGLIKMEKHLIKHKDTCEYYCEKCNVAFINDQRFQKHMNYAHALTCSICGKTFFKQSALTQHQEECQLRRLYLCKGCKEGFSCQEDLTYHRTKTCHKGPEICGICEKEFEKKKEMKYHLFTDHGIRNNQCTKCGKVSITQQGLKFHMRMHAPVACKVCSLVVIGRKSIVDHLRKHYEKVKEINGPIVCSTCGHNVKKAKNHWRMTHCSEEHLCRICDDMFERPEELDDHRRHHEGSFKCSICKESFNVWEDCINHMDKHDNELQQNDKEFHKAHKSLNHGKTYLCKDCGYSTTVSAVFKKHQIQHKPVACKICGLVVKGYLEISVHLTQSHNDFLLTVRSSSCATCCKDVANIRHHWMYESKYCGKEHICVICGDMFEFKTELDDHQESHKGPYVCSVCGHSFDGWEDCSSHVDSHGNRQGTSEKTATPELVELTDDKTEENVVDRNRKEHFEDLSESNDQSSDIEDLEIPQKKAKWTNLGRFI